MKEYKNYILGRWWDASDGSTFEIRNPAEQNQVLWTFPLSTKEDVRKAINGAREAFPAWAHLPAPDRGVILDKASQIITSRMEEMIGILTSEEGKTLAEAKAEMTRTRDLFRYFSGEGWRMGGDVLPSSINGEHLYTKREPLGVIAVITPWNFPVAIPAWKIAPALVYGNTVVFKPASNTPRSGLMIVEVLMEAGLPPGVINFITGSGRVVGDEIASHPGINGITFTGSYSTGCGIYNQAVKNMTRVQLEMGGKNPLVVARDANLDLAVNLAVRGGFGLTGETCTSTSRVIVEEQIADAFSQGITEAARHLIIGNGMDEKTQMGPAVSQDQLDTDLYYINIGKDEGAKLLAGGSRAVGGGFFIQPTVFDQVDTKMRIAQEEIFGPVISIIRANDFDDAVNKANDIGFGLSAGIVTNDLNKAFTFANRIEAGVVKINEPTNGIVVQAPFGGFKQSSANTFKEQGNAAIEFFTRTKTVYMNHG
jgi:acyl-CoA reductase-like NAD-dependent aldehyde dehydrogenase